MKDFFACEVLTSEDGVQCVSQLVTSTINLSADKQIFQVEHGGVDATV